MEPCSACGLQCGYVDDDDTPTWLHEDPKNPGAFLIYCPQKVNTLTVENATREDLVQRVIDLLHADANSKNGWIHEICYGAGYIEVIFRGSTMKNIQLKVV